MSITPRLILHGGAGNISRETLPPSSYAEYRKSLLSVLTSTSHLLSKGTSALEAATSAVVALENNALFNCSHGAVFTRSGTIELEASIMVSSGYKKRGAAVSLLKHVKNPILLAKEILMRGEGDMSPSICEDRGYGENGEVGDMEGNKGHVNAQGHVHLSGEQAEELAKTYGLELCEQRYFWTRRRWEEHKRGLARESHHSVDSSSSINNIPDWATLTEPYVSEDPLLASQPGWDGHEYLPQGTVGCVAMDSTGTLCVATSTGGITNKLVGRIGDTPTFGAGFWAEQWDELKSPAPPVVSPLDTILSSPLATTLQSCFGGSSSDYTHGMRYEDKKEQPTRKRAVALSGTGNGDAFLRIAAAHTAALIPRLVSSRSLQSSTTQVAGPRGELQRSAGDRWGKTGEGEGGLIGIEYVEGVGGNVVADFNCGGMFRAWVDDFGVGRMRVFRGKYSEEEE